MDQQPSRLPRPGEAAGPGRSYVSCGGDDDPAGGLGSIADWLAYAAAEHPRSPAVSWLDGGSVQSLSWAMLRSRAARVGASILARRPGTRRVGIVGSSKVEWIVTMYGVAWIGGEVIALPAGEPGTGLLDRAVRARVDVVLTIGEAAASAAAGLPVPVERFDDLERGDGPTASAPVRTSPTAPFLFQFTSGTTGRPKIAVLSHRALMGSARHHARAAGAPEGAVTFNPLPLDHVGGVVGGILTALAVVGSYAVLERFTPTAALEVIRDLRPAVVGLVPTMVIDILAVDGVTASDFDSVEVVIGGASNVEPSLIEELESRLDTTFLVAYGQSEAPCLTMSAKDDPLDLRTRTIGRGLSGRDFCVARDGDTVGEGEVGELWVRGPLLMSGYLDADGEIAPVTDEFGWMATGDLCSIVGGVLRFHSRARDVIIRGGENIYPAEIEEALKDLPGVSEIVVFAVPDRRLGEVPVAAIRVLPGVVARSEDLDAYASARLPRSKRPRHWYRADEFPRTSTGKVRRLSLAALLDEQLQKVQ